MGNHICKVCDSTNTEPDIKVDDRQRFKCLDCQILFFDDGVPFKSERGQSVELESQAEATIDKIYKCKKCEFSTADMYKLVGHYSSAHSWWHRGSEQKAEEPPVAETSHRERREQERPYNIKLAIMALAANDINTDEFQECLFNILCKYMKDEPVGTVKALIPDGKPFRIDDLLKAAMTMAIVSILEQSNEFEFIGGDTWRLKAHTGSEH